MKSAERGNILFLILLAVILFAALSYAVTSSTKGGEGKTASSEKVPLLAARLMERGALVANTVQRMMLVSGVPDYGFDLRPPGHGWTTQCATNACRIYNAQGGGIPSFETTAEMYDTTIGTSAYYLAGSWTSNGKPSVVRIKGVGTEAAGDVVIVFEGMNRAVCEEINRRVGLSNTYPLDPAAGVQYAPSTAAVPEPTVSTNSDIGDEVPELIGRTEFCLRNGNFSGKEFNYVKVLIPR